MGASLVHAISVCIHADGSGEPCPQAPHLVQVNEGEAYVGIISVTHRGTR